jgi:glycosyltransferase involved in cell wall biosynthesis
MQVRFSEFMNEPVTPLISVVMPVHNAQAFIDESISSILNQTLPDFEFVILDDASTDRSADAIREWARKDARIRFYQGTQCLGLSRSSNLVVDKARAPVIARMDADDISHPQRLERQWKIMQSSSDVVAVGTLCDGIDSAGREVRPRDRWRLVRRSRYIPFPHGSAMFRRETFDEVGGYREEFTGGEDQDLFSRMTSKGRVVTLPDSLYRYRYHLNNATLVSGTRSMERNYTHNGDALAAFYVVGAMRLWAGHPPETLRAMLAERSLKWNLQSLIGLSSAAWGSVSPGSLRLFLRGIIRSRDLLAGLKVEEGKPYEWRLE